TRRQERHLGGELMAGHTVEIRLARHFPQTYFGTDVTARLPAGRVHRYEAMDLETVAGGALHISERAGIRLEVHAMPGGGGDALPLLLFFVSLYVAAGTDARRHLRMHRDFLGTIGHPEIELPRAGENRLLMAAVAAERVVFRAGEPLERTFHDVAAGAEPVVVLHVVPADRAEPRGTDHGDGGGGGETDPD